MSKRVLGRGLGALIPGLSGSSSKSNITEVPVFEIEPNPNQPRKNFDQNTLREMVESVKEFGIIQPIIVRKKDNYYEIIAGERRWRAAKEAGLENIQVIVKDADNKDSIQMAIIENIQRENLNAIDEAKAYHHLITEYQMTQAELAAKIGKSRTAITNTLRLLSLPDKLKSLIIDGQISSGHARALLSLSDPKSQLEVAKKIIEENLSVRDVERMAKESQEETAHTQTTANKEKPISMRELAGELSNVLSAKVSVKAIGGKGQIKIIFTTLDELSHLVRTFQRAGSID